MEANLRNTKSSPKKGSKQSSTVEELKDGEEKQPGREQKSPKNIKRQQASGSDEPENLKAHVCNDRGKERESAKIDDDNSQRFVIRVQLDGASVVLFLLSFVTRFYKITHPKGVV